MVEVYHVVKEVSIGGLGMYMGINVGLGEQRHERVQGYECGTEGQERVQRV